MSQTELLGPTSNTFMSQRIRLHYADWGNPTAPPLILLHGGRDHGRSWDWVAQQLRHDYHVIAPDLRGHGDSAWSPDGNYNAAAYVYDLAQLIHQRRLAPVTIVAHSLGGAISLRYAGVFPETVRRLVAIEGVGIHEHVAEQEASVPAHWRGWVTERRAMSGRLARRYPTIQDALERMQAENGYLTAEQALHLTIHGVSQNEDGTYTWKFDNYSRSRSPIEMSDADLHALWRSITCPVLLCWGRNSWASDPATKIGLFQDARVAAFDDAGHWLHHDQFDAFMAVLRGFLAEPDRVPQQVG